MLPEIWLPVVGYEDLYAVSNVGNVKRTGGGRGAIKGRVLTRKPSTNGYFHIDLSRNDKKTRFGIHRLVAIAFIGPPPAADYEVNHKDGNKRNNVSNNLEWCTSAENNEHARAIGLWRAPAVRRGEDNPRSKLTKADVAEIRSLRGKLGARPIAVRFGVARSLIQRIHQGKLWTEELSA